MKYDLKRCPRCGSEAEPVCDEERESIHRENVVECCKCALCTDGYATVEEAVQAWNAREIKGNSIDLGYEDWDGIDITEFGKWISVKNRLPKSDERVQINYIRHSSYDNKDYQIQTYAVYQDGTLTEDDTGWIGNDDNWLYYYGAKYDEEKDVYYIPKGWYEVLTSINAEYFCILSEEEVVTHWMSLPELPEGV